MDFAIISRAQVSQSQFAALVGVHRVTVNTWFKGHFNPQVRLRARVRKALALLDKAVEDGHLPVPKDQANKELTERLSAIEAALRTEG